MSALNAPHSIESLLVLIQRHWGYSSLRPLQRQAMQAVLDGRDSLVVLPTGGGKSLCYQAPAALRGGITVVLSPLIALMKDQVDGLRACGIAAAQLDSSLSDSERLNALRELRQGRINLLFVSPERLVGTDLYRQLEPLDVHTFAIDEAHCISHWGHDFRPEYRMIGRLRELFPLASFHGYTATATEQVRLDIINQLALREPEVLVGNFDRPNLTYRVWPRHDVLRQVLEVIQRHPGEAGIVYCLRRADVDDLAARLLERGVNVRAYHAGMTSEQRQAAQNAFASEECDVVVATIAFGMGIDRSNVRFVVHAALPKSLEHYQQETGRAGRDGLEAECVLLYSGGDVVRLKSMIQKSAEEATDQSFLPAVIRHLEEMDRFARGAVCRHRALVNYFGQDYEPPAVAEPTSAPSCRACDLCLGDSEDVPDMQVVAQKILSCVARVKQRFGIGQVIDVLRGKNNEKVRKYNHDQLSVYGLLQDHSDADLRDWIYQLIGQEVLVQTEEEYPKLILNEASWEVMRNQRTVRLVRLVRRKKGEKPVAVTAPMLETIPGVDDRLFATLQQVRRQLAAARQVPAYIIFGDRTLREMAAVRPSTLAGLRLVYGVGETKLRDFGQAFLDAILAHCAESGTTTDQRLERPAQVELPGLDEPVALTARQREMAELFRRGMSIEQVMSHTRLARSTVTEYLAGYVQREQPADLSAWIPLEIQYQVRQAAIQVGTNRLKPIYVALGEKVPYDQIRVVLAWMQGAGAASDQ